MKHSIEMNGSAKVEVIDHNGKIVSSLQQPNLILDAGMNRLATVVIADLFLSCARGTGTTDTKETITLSTYQQAGTAVTRTGYRDFVDADVGRVIKFNSGAPARIQSHTTSAAVVDVSQTIGPGASAIIYSVDQPGLITETHRTSSYSVASGDNGTTDAASVRTLKRTFVFPPEASAPITVNNPYSKASNVVTRVSGSVRDFTIDDEGSYIRFPTLGVEYLITTFTNASTVVVNDSAQTISNAASIIIYGRNTYSEIGFSNTLTAGANLNSRIKLASPVSLQTPTAERPGQQMRVTYSLAVTVSPTTSANGTAPISDPSNIMSGAGSKTGAFMVESLAISSVDERGATIYTNAALEPSIPGYVGLSTSFATPAFPSSTARSAGLGFVQAVNLEYTSNSFSQTLSADFGVNDAVGTAKRSILLFSDTANPVAAFVFVFVNNQSKPATAALKLQFKKNWSRTLN